MYMKVFRVVIIPEDTLAHVVTVTVFISFVMIQHHINKNQLVNWLFYTAPMVFCI